MKVAEKVVDKNKKKVKEQTRAPYIILVVEDDESLSRLIHKKLAQEGFVTESALSGSEAITWLAQNPNTLLLLDYQLPDMTGEQVIKSLADRKCCFPFIILTGHGDEKLAVRMMKLGARNYLVKEKRFLDLLPSILNQVMSELETEKKLSEAQEALKRSQQKHRTLLDNMHDAIVVVDKQGIMRFVNSAAESIFGQCKDELLGGMFGFGVSGDEATEIKCIHSDGRLVIGEMRIVESEWEGEPAFIVSTRDITERKRAEEKLREAHTETEKLLASISSILIGISRDDQVTRWNAAAEQSFGIKAEHVVGKSFLKCDLKWDWNELQKRISECRDKDQPTHLHDIQFIRVDGKKGFLDITINPIANDTGPADYVLLATETTERKTLESQLLQAQKLESIGQLAAGIAHEINTPIQYVGDNTRFLQDAFSDIGKLLTKYEQVIEVNKTGSVNNELIKEVEVISEEVDLDYLLDEIPTAIQQSQEGTERVANIVRAMKEFAHPGTDEKTLTDINKALGSTITVAQNEWKYVAEMETDFDPSLPLVRCLPGELNQVFLNIIINAAHAIAGAVDESSDEKGTITVSTCCENEWVKIQISDTGAGIPEEAGPRIFDPFFTTKEIGKGTGQGLAISYAVVVEKHGGSITFETEMGKGTTFVIHLPLGSSN